MGIYIDLCDITGIYIKLLQLKSRPREAFLTSQTERYSFLFMGFYRSFHKIIFQDHKQADFASLHFMSETKTETLNGDLARRVRMFSL